MNPANPSLVYSFASSSSLELPVSVKMFVFPSRNLKMRADFMAVETHSKATMNRCGTLRSSDILNSAIEAPTKGTVSCAFQVNLR